MTATPPPGYYRLAPLPDLPPRPMSDGDLLPFCQQLQSLLQDQWVPQVDRIENMTMVGLAAEKPDPEASRRLYFESDTGDLYFDDNTSTWSKIAPSGGGASDFLGLSDTPSSYSGQTGKSVRVKSDESGLEFITPGGGVTTFLGLSDTPSSYSGQALKVLRVNAGESALEFYTPTVAGTFLGLSDTPVSYVGRAGQTLRVNTGETALEFYTPTAAGTFLGLSDTPSSYSGCSQLLVRVTAAENALEFSNLKDSSAILLFPYGKSIQGRGPGGTARGIAEIDGSDVLILGDFSYAGTKIEGAASAYLLLDANPFLSKSLTIPYGQSYNIKDSGGAVRRVMLLSSGAIFAGDSDVPLYVDASLPITFRPGVSRELRMAGYIQQSTQPTFSVTGTFAIWRDTSADRTYLLVKDKTTGTYRKVELT